MKVKVAAIETLSLYCQLLMFIADSHFVEIWPSLATTIDERSSFEPIVSALGVLRRIFRSKSIEDTGDV